MASYTMPLKEVISMLSYSQGTTTAENIEIGRTQLFDFDYPIFDADYKKVFETHFIRKFYMREIGFETEGRFKFELENWLVINMTYFNKLFESELLMFDPLSNTKLDTTSNKKNDKTNAQTSNMDGTNDSTSETDSNGNLTDTHFDRQLDSDTPDTRLAITTQNGKGVIEYASSIKENTENDTKVSTTVSSGKANDTSKINSSMNGSINEVEDFIVSKTGKIGDQTFSKMLNEYRDSFIRIENKIFNEMQELFMLVY